jgi:hypothetical protein
MKKTSVLLASVFVLLNFCTCKSVQSQQNDERATIAKEFVVAIKEGILSNEEIMKKFVTTRYYFNPDSSRFRAAADEHLNQLRKSAQSIDLTNHVAYPYVGHEDEFAVMASASVDEKPTKKHLEFSFDPAPGVSLEVDMNDLYVIGPKDEKGKGMIILFDDKNRILSFTSMRFRNHVGYWQW